MPMTRANYPDDWEQTALAVKAAADWICQKCGKQCRRPGEKMKDVWPEEGHRRTLTVAHLDHDEGNQDARLMAMCAPCHCKYDGPEKARRRREKRANGE